MFVVRRTYYSRFPDSSDSTLTKPAISCCSFAYFPELVFDDDHPPITEYLVAYKTTDEPDAVTKIWTGSPKDAFEVGLVAPHIDGTVLLSSTRRMRYFNYI